MRLGVMSSMDYLPFALAQQFGFYDTIGLKVSFVKFFSANDRDAAFQSGNIDGTIIDFTGAAIQQANGIDLALVMKNDGYFSMIANKESGIEKPEQLKEKSIVVSHNTVIEYATDKMLEHAGIPVASVNKPEINKIPLRMEMLQNGQIEAGVFPDPFLTIAKGNGHRELMTTQDLDLYVTGTMFSGQALREKRQEIQALMEGYNLAIDYIHHTKVEDWLEIVPKEIGIPEALVSKIVLPHFVRAELPRPKDIQETVKWLKQKQLIPATYDGSKLVDPSFIQADKE